MTTYQTQTPNFTHISSHTGANSSTAPAVTPNQDVVTPATAPTNDVVATPVLATTCTPPAPAPVTHNTRSMSAANQQVCSQTNML